MPEKIKNKIAPSAIRRRGGKAHLIGICGKGMSALAIMLRQKGWKITGSDENFYDPIYSLLRRNGIKFEKKYSAGNVPKDADMIVIGKHAGLVPELNEEVRAALALIKNKGLPAGRQVKSMPEALGQLAEKTENTVVAGSFGKSTVAALLAWCLFRAGKDPSYFIGAAPLGFKINARLGRSRHFIMEGDEYPSANWDSTAKFLYLRPKNIVLTSAEHDHINVFPTEKEYVQPYRKLISLLPKDGLLVYCRDGKNTKWLAKIAKCRKVSYSAESAKADWRAENTKYGPRTSFDLFHGKKKIIRLETGLLGKHNIENIVGASALLLEKKIIGPAELRRTVKTFQGLSGRIDLKKPKSPVPVYEIFGSSYSKTKSALRALRLHFPRKKIIAVFEPHAFSWRNSGAKKWYKDVFREAQEVIVLPPPEYGNRELRNSSPAHFLKLSQADGMKIKLLLFSSDSERNCRCERKRTGNRARMSEKSADFYATVQKVAPRKSFVIHDGKDTHEQMDFAEILRIIKRNKKKTYGAKNERETLDLLKKITRKNNLIALISSGALFGLAKSAPRLMKSLF